MSSVSKAAPPGKMDYIAGAPPAEEMSSDSETPTAQTTSSVSDLASIAEKSNVYVAYASEDVSSDSKPPSYTNEPPPYTEFARASNVTSDLQDVSQMTLSERDPIAALMPRAQTTSRFHHLKWLPWNYRINTASEDAHMLEQAPYAGIKYAINCLRSKVTPELLSLYGPDTMKFLHGFSPYLDTEEITEIIKGNQSILATYHAGAMYLVRKMREAIGEKEMEEQFDECIDDFERELHRQLAGRIAMMAQEAGLIETVRKAQRLHEMIEKNVEDLAGEEEIDDGKGIAGGGDAQHGGKDEGIVAYDDNPKRARNRAKSKKAKKEKNRLDKENTGNVKILN